MVNKVILIGNIGADPEIRTLEGGVKVARLRMATTERIYNRTTQETTEHVEWHSITLWRGMADVADRFVRKGSQIYIEGRIRSRDWTDESGAKRYAIEIVADEMKLLGRRPEGTGPPASVDGTTSYGASPASSVPSAAPSRTAQGQTPVDAPTTTPTTTPTMAPAAINQQDDPDDLPF